MDIQAVDLGELPGLAEIAAGLPPGADDQESARILSQRMNETGIPMQATMGSWDRFHNLMDWIRNRSLVRELPEQVIQVPWFACHVPMKGTALVTLKASQADDLSVGLKVFGSGFGTGRGLNINVSSDTEPRKKCATYAVDIRVRPKIYCQGTQESVVLDVIGEAGTRSETLETCPYCRLSKDTLNPFEYELSEYLDLRGDTVRHKRKVNLQWTKNNKLDVGFTIPGIQIPVTLSLSATASSQAEWELAYEFAPGYLYQPFKKREEPGFLPPRWSSSR